MKAVRPRRLLDALIVLAVAFALPIFYLVEKILNSRSDGDDDENNNLRRSRLSPMKNSLQREPPFRVSMSGACCPVQVAIKKAKRNGNPNEPKPKMNRNVVCAGCGKPIRIGEQFYRYRSMMNNNLMYLHKDEECWKLYYNKWRGIKQGRGRGDE